MKPVVIDIREMSDSKEVYLSRPNPFLAIFIYAVLAIILVSLVWSWFGQVDIVVSGSGSVRPNEQVSTVWIRVNRVDKKSRTVRLWY